MENSKGLSRHSLIKKARGLKGKSRDFVTKSRRLWDLVDDLKRDPLRDPYWPGDDAEVTRLKLMAHKKSAEAKKLWLRGCKLRMEASRYLCPA